jgi:probable F420-dependent oxidoreductase
VKLGFVYPQTELDGNARALHEIGIAVEALGYDCIAFYDHVAGAEHADREPPLTGPYTERDPFHDPLVALTYLAAVTERIELATSVLVLAQRQTVLVARQVADLDLLSGGRVRLGVGTGWNWVEYDSLGIDFSTRGRRLEEQIHVLRALWTERLVTFHGTFHDLERMAVNPRPARAIPIWIGGFTEPAFRRAGRVGDGFTFGGDFDRAVRCLDRIRGYLAEAGRTADGFGAEFIVQSPRTDEVAAQAARWQQAGGTHLSVVTMNMGLDSSAAHLDLAASFRERIAAELGPTATASDLPGLVL